MEILALFIIACALYFVPSIVAVNRGRAVGPVILLNLLLGWTLVGWVAALIWASTERTALEQTRRAPAV